MSALLRWLRKAVPVIVSVIVLVSAIVGILQFVGVTHFDLFASPTATTRPAPPTPTVAALIGEDLYETHSPACDLSDVPVDLAWDVQVATFTCLPKDGGTVLAQKSTSNVGSLFLLASARTAFAPNHSINATFTQLADRACAALATRHSGDTAGIYAFYICGNGDWFIIKYTVGGVADVLAQSGADGSPYAHATVYTMTVTVDGARLSMTVNSGLTRGVTDTSYSLTRVWASWLVKKPTLPTRFPAIHCHQ
jgi:hypothetical protein